MPACHKLSFPRVEQVVQSLQEYSEHKLFSTNSRVVSSGPGQSKANVLIVYRFNYLANFSSLTLLSFFFFFLSFSFFSPQSITHIRRPKTKVKIDEVPTFEAEADKECLYYI